MRRNDCSWWFGVLVVLGGCVGAAPTAEMGEGGDLTLPSSPARQGKGGSDADAGAAGAHADEAQPFASTGWLDKEGSALYPWCAAVLVAPRVVLTGASCAHSDIHELSFGVGTPGGAGVAVVDSLRLEGDPRVVALLLERPIEEVEPAELAVPAEEGDAHDGSAVSGIAMRYAERGQTSERWVWPGVLHTQEELRVEVDSTELDEVDAEAPPPSCHGDNGTGVYTQTGLLAGIVVAASGAGVCADTFTLSPLSARALVEQALSDLGISPESERPIVTPE